jgi:hypothetical protein
MMFLQMAEGVDAETWQFHRARHDYSSWFEHVIKDRELAREAAEIETADTPPERARKRLRQVVERRYTLPA